MAKGKSRRKKRRAQDQYRLGYVENHRQDKNYIYLGQKGGGHQVVVSLHRRGLRFWESREAGRWRATIVPGEMHFNDVVAWMQARTGIWAILPRRGDPESEAQKRRRARIARVLRQSGYWDRRGRHEWKDAPAAFFRVIDPETFSRGSSRSYSCWWKTFLAHSIVSHRGKDFLPPADEDDLLSATRRQIPLRQWRAAYAEACRLIQEGRIKPLPHLIDGWDDPDFWRLFGLGRMIRQHCYGGLTIKVQKFSERFVRSFEDLLPILGNSPEWIGFRSLLGTRLDLVKDVTLPSRVLDVDCGPSLNAALIKALYGSPASDERRPISEIGIACERDARRFLAVNRAIFALPRLQRVSLDFFDLRIGEETFPISFHHAHVQSKGEHEDDGWSVGGDIAAGRTRWIDFDGHCVRIALEKDRGWLAFPNENMHPRSQVRLEMLVERIRERHGDNPLPPLPCPYAEWTDYLARFKDEPWFPEIARRVDVARDAISIAPVRTFNFRPPRRSNRTRSSAERPNVAAYRTQFPDFSRFASPIDDATKGSSTP